MDENAEIVRVEVETHDLREKGPKCNSKKESVSTFRSRRSSTAGDSFRQSGESEAAGSLPEESQQILAKIRDSPRWQPPAGLRVPRTRREVKVFSVTVAACLPPALPPNLP